MTLTVYAELEQGTDEWFEARRGLVTASTVKNLLTATGRVADNDTSRTLTFTLALERATGHVEPVRETSDMARGHEEEPYARLMYVEHHAPVTEVGFMIRTLDNGVRLGYSPDGLVGDDGLIEIKSPRYLNHARTFDTVPAEYMPQLQAGLLVSGREWIDYVSFAQGLPFKPIRVEPDPKWQSAITEAVERFETNATQFVADWVERTSGLPVAERRPQLEDIY